MKIQEALMLARRQLSAKENPSLDSRLLLAHALEKTRPWLHINHQSELSPKQKNNFITLIRRRRSGIPLVYLINRKNFWESNFYIDERVLIPRPETERLVERALLTASAKLFSSPKSTLTIADIGTGSGCIAISIALSLTQEFPRSPWQIYATDISPACLEIASYNAENILESPHRIKFLEGSLLQPLPTKADLIVANLPYLSSTEYRNASREIRSEPRQALVGGNRGNELIEALLDQAEGYLKSDGRVVYENTQGECREFKPRK